MSDEAWEKRIAELWAALDTFAPEELVTRMDALVAERPAGDAVGCFERASARDSTGHSDEAIPRYRAALAGARCAPS